MEHIRLNNEIMVRDKDGFFQIEKDLLAVEAFEKVVRKEMVFFKDLKEKLKYMISNDFYYDVFSEYSFADVKKVYDLVYSYKFEFKSFMSISKFYRDYAMKTNDKKKYLETYEDRIAIVALYLSRGYVEKALQLAEAMIEQLYQPATPTFLNAGRSRRGEMVSCFLLEMDDSLNSINFNVGTSGQLSKIGGGVAINTSKIRGRGEPIKEIENSAKGVVPVMKLLEHMFSYADQMGQRKGAGAVYYNIFGWDIVEVLDTKKINADEKIRLKTLSLGLITPAKFYELAEKNELYYVFAPYSVYKAYGVHLDDMDIDEMYDELIQNPNVKKRIPMNGDKPITARDMLNKIAQTQLESGYPYLMFRTNAQKQHALNAIGKIKMTNLCTEIFQLQETSVINDYGVPDEIKRDINCNLGSLNIVNVMERKKLRFAVHVATEALTAVSDMTVISNAPTVKKANEELHSIGLGAMNLHGFLAKNKIQYDSEYAKEFARAFFMSVNFYSIEKSMEIARERGETFKDFELSDYATGKYFEKYIEKSYLPTSDKVKKLFEGIELPTPQDWKELEEKVKKHGMYNAYRLAIAPTGSISYVQNATASVMPIVDMIESRTYANSTTYYPAPYLSKETAVFYFKNAYEINQFKLIDLIAEIQEHVDQGISTTLHVNSDISTRELARFYIYAHKKGLKSLYYTRTRLLSVSECTSCAV